MSKCPCFWLPFLCLSGSFEDGVKSSQQNQTRQPVQSKLLDFHQGHEMIIDQRTEEAFDPSIIGLVIF
jgi:hypothetical protein